MKKVIFRIFMYVFLCFLFLFLTGCNLFLDFIDSVNKNPETDNENKEIKEELGPLPETLNGAVVIDSGFSTSTGRIHNGMCLYHDTNTEKDYLFLTSWNDKKLTKIEISSNTIVNGFPVSLSNVSNLFGLSVNPLNGDIWICDPDNPGPNINIARYMTNMDYTAFNTGSYPVNSIIIDNKIYIADSGTDTIYYTDIPPGNRIDGFTPLLIPMSEKNSQSEYIDMAYDNGIIYVVSKEINGIQVIDLNPSVPENEIYREIHINGKDPLRAVGIKILDNKFYLNLEKEILIIDKNTLKILKTLTIVSTENPGGYTGNYIDIEIINGKIYMPSWIGGNFDTIGAHILVYDDPS